MKAGDTITVKSTGKPVTVIASSGGFVLVRTAYGSQWTYARDEVE